MLAGTSLLLAPADALHALDEAAQTLPAFPGAEGFGAVATGGRGGEVYHVRNLNDSGPGSFRDAVSQDNRIVVFDVGGYAATASTNRTVNAAIEVHNNITIAGQTAPGDGFGVIGREVSFSGATNVVCRFVRFRQGMLDGHHAGNSVGMFHGYNIILDHVSIGFGQWNDIDAVAATNITFQSCIIADPVGQRFCAHTEGGPFCWFRNLWANAHNRQPMARADTVFVNNVVYDYEAAYTTTTHEHFHHDLVNNYFVAGPATHRPSNCFFQVNTDQFFYATGNLLDANKDGKLNGASVSPGESVSILKSPHFAMPGKLPTTDALTALRVVLSDAGCSLQRDALDRRTIEEVLSFGKSGFIRTNQMQSGLSNCGYGTLAGGASPADSDGDGMPDYYENALGLDAAKEDHNTPLASADGRLSGTTFFPGGTQTGYTRLDEYLHFLAIPHGLVAQGGSVAVDLKKFTIGFTASPKFTITNVIGGRVTQSGPGNSLVAFTPPPNHSGRARFDFTVTDSEGKQWTQTYAIVVTRRE
jgi:pectate lyase